LAITRAIVEMHGGAIWAESAGRGHGATFTVELNTIPAPQPGTEPGARSLSAEGPGKLRILFVEDHDSTRDVLSRILRRSGHEVHVAGSGAEALDIVSSAGRFDVLISDIGLPDQSGFELMRTIKARYDLPGIALSGYGMEEDVRMSLEAGFERHLTKPIDLRSLQTAIRETVAAR
jgi:CheY-like chemotaxis protein